MSVEEQAILYRVNADNGESIGLISNQTATIMGSYFKPWRRKIGVLTLVMACFLSIRRLGISDQLCLPFGKSSYTLISARWHLALFYAYRDETRAFSPEVERVYISPTAGDDFFAYMIHYSNGLDRSKWVSDSNDLINSEALERDPLLSREQIWGIVRAARTEKMNGSMETLIIYLVPNWYITLPVTLLSAWLLLSRPRVKTKPTA